MYANPGSIPSTFLSNLTIVHVNCARKGNPGALKMRPKFQQMNDIFYGLFSERTKWQTSWPSCDDFFEGHAI